MRLSKLFTFKYFLIIGSLVGLCYMGTSHARPNTSKRSIKPKKNLSSYRVVVVNCADQYVEVKGSNCKKKRVGVTATKCRKIKLGHQVFLNKKKNKVSGVLGAYRSWGGTIKVLNSQDNYLEIKSCEAQCKIGATSAIINNFRVGQKVNAILRSSLTWSRGRCTGNARSIRSL
jgi:hypothetical protein